ncbi:DUF2625 family protein [Streptomyces sp. NPDC055089]
MRQLSELTDVDDPAWPVLQEEFANSSAPVEALPGDPGQGRACPLRLRVGARSAVGALVLHSGGLVADHLSGEFRRQTGLGDPGFLGSLLSEGRA